MSLADQRAQELINYAFQCKARAQSGATHFGSPGRNTVIAQLVNVVLTDLAVTYPTVFVDIGKHFLEQRASAMNPPVYGKNDEESKK